MPPMQPQPPAPRPLQPFRSNNNGSMQNTGWRDAYMNSMNSSYRDDPRPTLPGFYISSPQNISARDVPMDGSISFFPAEDLSYIIIKQWSGNGMISEARYIPAPPVTQTQEQPQQQDPQDTPNNSANDQNSKNSEVVEVISAALNEQTQRLTAAFSQIGVAFSTLQQKLDELASVPASNPRSESMIPAFVPSSEDEHLLPPGEMAFETEPKIKRQKKETKE